jgi:hypothetical protein
MAVGIMSGSHQLGDHFFKCRLLRMEFGYPHAAGIQQRNELSQRLIDIGGDKAQQCAGGFDGADAVNGGECLRIYGG